MNIIQNRYLLEYLKFIVWLKLQVIMIDLVVLLEPTLGGTRRYCLDVLSRIDCNRFKVTFIYSLYRADSAFLDGLKELEKMGITLVEINMVFLSHFLVNSLFQQRFIFKRPRCVDSITEKLNHRESAISPNR